MEITIHEEKISHFTFHGKKKGRSRVTKIPFTTLRHSVVRKTSTIASGTFLVFENPVRKCCFLFIRFIHNLGFALYFAYKFASPTTSSNSAPDTSWFLTCTARWFPTTYRKTVRLARPVRLVLERYVTLTRTMIKQMPPILMSRKYLQGKKYKTRQNVSNSR